MKKEYMEPEAIRFPLSFEGRIMNESSTGKSTDLQIEDTPDEDDWAY